MALHAELHRHLGGSVVPRVLWRYLLRQGHPLAERFAVYEDFENFYTQPRATLEEYLELHTLVESVQTLEELPYFVYRLIRGAYVFENLAYLELRYTPYYRTNHHLTEAERIQQMKEVVQAVGEAARQTEYPIITTQLLCLHTRLPYAVNRAIVELAAKSEGMVSGIDMAGGTSLYAERMDEFVELYKYALALGLKTTAHLYETEEGSHPQLLPYISRIGHGIQIPLRYPELLAQVAQRGQCLEVCPTTYFQTGNLQSIDQLKVVFQRCFDSGVDIAICTDNAGLHNVRLPFEYENLLTRDVIDFHQMRRCQENAFRHAFAWPYLQPPQAFLSRLTAKATTLG
ncbi:amidohydrolase family protein [Anthocerotibacter panamensis]|uniref:adenosine deaminase n=1 Tax=Anthocerotibacter panamensis TaxID=2857077 RepID=UPI001C406F3D|nr:adenosine deaminase [Anthocerotibacter panamensis]